MGIFKGLNDLEAAGRENLARDEAEMAALNLIKAPPAPPPSIAADDARPATATVVHFAQTNTVVNLDPVVELDLLVMAPGTAPRPVTIQPALSLAQIPHVQPGASLSVTLSRSDPTLAIIDWPSEP